MNTAHIYIRCSHQDSAESGLGLAAQEEIATAYYNLMRLSDPRLKDVTLSDTIFKDIAISAYKPTTASFSKRPAGAALLEVLQSGDHIIFAKLDRSFRNLRQMLNWLDRWKNMNVTVHFADYKVDMSTPFGQMVINMMGAFAQFESAQKSERTKEGLRQSELKNGRIHLPRGFHRIKRNHRTVGYRIDHIVQVRMRFARWKRWQADGRKLSWRKVAMCWEECIARREGRHMLVESRWEIQREMMRGHYRNASVAWPDRYPPPPKSDQDVGEVSA